MVGGKTRRPAIASQLFSADQGHRSSVSAMASSWDCEGAASSGGAASSSRAGGDQACSGPQGPKGRNGVGAWCSVARCLLCPMPPGSLPSTIKFVPDAFSYNCLGVVVWLGSYATLHGMVCLQIEYKSCVKSRIRRRRKAPR